jgi:undecaprenyl-diphosphatase
MIIAFLYFLKQSRDRQRRIIIFSLISLPAIYIVAKTLSIFYYNPRPFALSHSVPLIFHVPDNGFTSDHVLLSSAISAIIFYLNRKLGILLLMLAMLVGIARVLAGVHHPIDVIGSIVIAFSVSFLIYRNLLPKVMNLRCVKNYFNN